METNSARLASIGVPMFEREWLSSYDLVTAPGKYILRSAINVTEDNLVHDGQHQHYNMVFRAVAVDQLSNLKKAFGGKDEAPKEDILKLLMSCVARVGNRGNSNLPLKGERLEVYVDFKKDDDGQDVLTPMSFRVHDPQIPEKIEVNKLLGPAAEERSNIIADALKENETLLEH